MQRAIALNANARLEGRALRRVPVDGWLTQMSRFGSIRNKSATPGGAGILAQQRQKQVWHGSGREGVDLVRSPLSEP